MQGYFVLGLFLLLIILVAFRARQLKSLGIKAIRFGELDKKDFLLPPFVLLFIYLLIAHVFDLPRIGSPLFENTIISWLGVGCGVLGVCLFAWALISFGRSFRVGLDEVDPGSLVTTGAFGISRNPIYVAFFLVLLGVFLVYPTVIFALYLIAAVLVLHRQVLLEEASLVKVYGPDYVEYRKRVSRYL